jgi:hypothetical protein
VIYLQRTIPELTAAYDKQGIEQRFPTDRFLPDLGWLDPDTVETRLGRISGGSDQATAPGLHGTGLQGVAVQPSGTELTDSGVNRVPVADQMTFDVTVQNQGESDETDVAVSISITNGKDINVEQTIPGGDGQHSDQRTARYAGRQQRGGRHRARARGRHPRQQPGALSGGLHGMNCRSPA